MKTQIKNILNPSATQSLSQKTAHGTFWLFSFRVVDQFLRLARTIILARLLAPNDFGLFGITVMAVSLLDTFSQNGFGQALTQKKGDISSYLDTAWVVQVLRGVLLAIILFLLAPFVAVFFKAPESEVILRVVALGVLLQAFYNIAIVYFSKELEFHKYFFWQIIGTIVEFVVSVIIAIIFKNVWALVFGLLAGTLARLVVSYVICRHYPRFIFNFLKAKELFSFGKWVFFANIIAFFTMQIDGFFVAKMLGVVALGFYQIAYKIPSILAIDILAGAIFPTYAKIKDDLPKIKEAYLKILKLFSFVLLPATGGLFIITPEFIRLFLGEKWLPASSAMQVLILSTLVWTIAVLSNYVFLALGKPEIETKGVSIRLVLLALLLYPFVLWWGIFGASLAVLISAVFSATWFAFMVVKKIDCKLSDIAKAIFLPLANTLCMILAISVFKNMFPVVLWSFLLLIISGILIYSALTYIADKVFKQNMIRLLKETMSLLIK